MQDQLGLDADPGAGSEWTEPAGGPQMADTLAASPMSEVRRARGSVQTSASAAAGGSRDVLAIASTAPDIARGRLTYGAFSVAIRYCCCSLARRFCTSVPLDLLGGYRADHRDGTPHKWPGHPVEVPLRDDPLPAARRFTYPPKVR